MEDMEGYGGIWRDMEEDMEGYGGGGVPYCSRAWIPWFALPTIRTRASFRSLRA